MSSSKVLLILGAGGNIGASVAKLFAQNGYKVALAARRLQDGLNEDGQLNIHADLAKADSVESAFDKVSSQFGPPSVVVYNGMCSSFHFIVVLYLLYGSGHRPSCASGKPIRSFPRRLQPRHCSEHCWCFDFRQKGSAGIPALTFTCYKDVYLHWQLPQQRGHAILDERRHRKKCFRSPDGRCFKVVCFKRISVIHRISTRRLLLTLLQFLLRRRAKGGW